MGSSIGPALAKQLIASLGASKVSVQGIDYTATIQSNALRGSEGGKVMARLANDQLARCSSTKIAIAGYSQGAMVVHYAVKTAGLSPNVVSSAVVYGDPQNRESVGSLPASRTKVLSHHSRIPAITTDETAEIL
jgi:triacylglycerol esterase/lipase EstA (alpha/beta hydrolase family)